MPESSPCRVEGILLTQGRAEHGVASTEEELSRSSETSADEISDPVEPLVVPFAGKESGTECTSRVESTTRNGSTDECEESESESDSDRGKTSLGVTGSGIDGELLALSGLVAFLGTSGLDGIESSSEDDVYEDVGEDELHQEHLANRNVVGASEGNECGSSLSARAGREDDP